MDRCGQRLMFNYEPINSQGYPPRYEQTSKIIFWIPHNPLPFTGLKYTPHLEQLNMAFVLQLLNPCPRTPFDSYELSSFSTLHPHTGHFMSFSGSSAFPMTAPSPLSIRSSMLERFFVDPRGIEPHR